MATLKEWVELIGLTAEACGTQISDAGLKMMAGDLAQYDFGAVGVACAKCRRELKYRLTLSDIIERLQADDGRYTADEAWGKLPKNGDYGAMVTTEMDEAAGFAWALLEAGDKVAARMAFKDAYEKIVADARAAGRKPVWRVSMGLVGGNTEAAAEGLRRGLLNAEQLKIYLPPEQVDYILEMQQDTAQLLLPKPDKVPQLAPPTEQGKQYALQAKELIQKIIKRVPEDE